MRDQILQNAMHQAQSNQTNSNPEVKLCFKSSIFAACLNI